MISIILFYVVSFLHAVIAQTQTVSLQSVTGFGGQRQCALTCFNGQIFFPGAPPNYLAEWMQCSIYPIVNDCLCRTDLQPSATSALSACIQKTCSNENDISTAISYYVNYCGSNGYSDAAISYAAVTTEASSTSTTPTSTTPTSTLVTSTTSQQTSQTSRQTISTTTPPIYSPSSSSDPSLQSSSTIVTSGTYWVIPAPTQTGGNSNGSGGDNGGSGLNTAAIIGIVVGALGFIATTIGAWFAYKAIRAPKA